MNFYSVALNGEPDFASTMDGAKAIMKTADPAFRADVRIELVDVATDKESILVLLNGGGERADGTSVISKPTKVWKGTARGGVVEIDPETSKDL